jgi:Lon protease-like protein
MIMPPSAAAGRPTGPDYGTMLDIKKVRMLPDGRSMVETQGTYRFRIMERGNLDGYMVSRIERFVLRPLTCH